MASSELRRHCDCDTELSLGRRRAPITTLAAAAASRRWRSMRVARGAALEEGPARRVAVGDGADSRRRLSVRRSLELFLRQRREARCQQLFAAGAGATASPSSSSRFTDS